MSTTTATSPALLFELRWEHGQTDLGKKPLSRIEWAILGIHECAEQRAAYFEAFEAAGWILADVQDVFDEHPEYVRAARDTAIALINIRALVTDRRQRGVGALADEWVKILLERYPNAATVVETALAA